jgi:hypothetical protein
MQGEIMRKIIQEKDALTRMRNALKVQDRKSQAIKPISTQVREWLNCGPRWSIGFSLHMPEKLRIQQMGNDHLWAERQVAALFSILAKVIYSGTPARQRPKLRRVVTLEYSVDVGWHAHGLISTPSHLDDTVLIEAIKDIWHERMDSHCRPYFKDRLVWCELVKGDYLGYSIKNTIENDFHNKDNKAGMISLRNTVL